MSELGEEEKDAMGPDSLTSLASSYRDRSMMFSAAELAGLKLVIKSSKSEKKSAMYVQTTLKRRETRNAWPESGVGAGVDYMMKDDIGDESAFTVFQL